MLQFKNLSCCLLLGATVFFTACDYTGNEKNHPLFSKAGICAESGNYEEAVKAYEELLTVVPNSALTHYKLADIYAKNLNNPYKAYYHYMKATELTDPNSYDAKDMQRLAANSKESMFKKLSEEYQASNSDVEQLKNELRATHLKLVAYQEALQKSEDGKKALEKERNELHQRLSAYVGGGGTTGTTRGGGTTTTGTGVSTGGTTTGGTGISGGTAGGTTTTDVYVVKKGDTLMKIARETYGSASHYTYILNANKDQLGENGDKIRVGQQLKIPPLPTRN